MMSCQILSVSFNLCECRRFRKSNLKRAPKPGIPTEWQHYKVNWRNVTQTRKSETLKAAKINEMLCLFFWLSGIIGQQFLCYFTSTSVAASKNHTKKVNLNLEYQQNYSIPRPVCETSVKKEKLWKRRKSTKCYVHFHNFPESSAKNFILFHICKCRRFRKSHQKSEPELGMPAELQHSKASLWNVDQKRKTLKAAKINKMLC